MMILKKKDEIVSHYTTTAAFAELLKPDAYFYGTHCVHESNVPYKGK